MDVPKKAKAAVMVGPQKVEIREYPVGPPKARQILVKIHRANICGSDLHMFRGEAFGQFGFPFSFVMGHEMVGRIVALGEGTGTDSRGEPLEVGDLVTFAYYRGCNACPVCARGKAHACFSALTSVIQNADEAPHLTGGFADYYYVRAGQAVFKIPQGVPEQLVAGCNCALAQVIHGLKTANVSYGDQVVIQGAGGLGLYATAVAKKRGASKVIVIDGVKSRLELAKEFGADHVISIEEMPDAKERTSKVQELTGGGPDVCVEVVGRAVALNEGIRMLQRGGRYVVMGAIVPRDTFKADPSIWVGGNLTLYGVSLYDTLSLAHAIDFVAEMKGKLPMEKMFAQTFPLTDINKAFETAEWLSNQKTNSVRVQLVME